MKPLLLLLLLAQTGLAQARPDSVRLYDARFWAVVGAAHGAMVADVALTFAVANACDAPDDGCRSWEANPIARPFVRRGALTAYVAATAFQVGVAAVSVRLRASKNPEVRRYWWVPQATLIIAHGAAALFNGSSLIATRR